jgi:hypothetical protein
MGPVVIPVGTRAVIFVDETTVNVVAVPLNVTEVAPVKFVPAIVTFVPGAPVVGVKLVIRGATVKRAALVDVPAGVVTEIGPDVAFAGTVAVNCVAEFTAKLAAMPLNLTAVAPTNAVPVITTELPIPPLVGLNPLMVD